MTSGTTSKSALPAALVVEDNTVLRFIAALTLQKLGYDVSTAANGLVAVIEAQKKSFAVILMDVQMPVMDGLECTRQIRNIEKFTGWHATVIGVSAAVAENQCISAGMDSFIPKPLTMESLMTCLEIRENQNQSGSGRR